MSASTRSGAKYNKTQLIEYCEKQFKDLNTKFESIRSSDVDMRVEGNMAFITGVRQFDGVAADGKPLNFKLRYSDTYIKKDGQWMKLTAADMNIKDSEAK